MHAPGALARRPANAVLAGSLVFAVFLWGATNAGTKYVVGSWPPIWTGGSRFLCAGALLLVLLRFTKVLGIPHPLTPDLRTRLWWRGGLSLAVYIVVFNTALRLTSASHVALYLGASPVWALLWEGKPERSWRSAQKYGAALLALAGIFVLFWPALAHSEASWPGEVLGLGASVLWTHYGRECRKFGSELSGAETTAHTMWRAGLLLMPLALVEIWHTGLPLSLELGLVHLYCIVGGGVVSFGLWNNALRYWPASQVLVFNNLIPLSTMSWAYFCLGEPVTVTFWAAMALVAAGVLLSQRVAQAR